MKNTGFFIFILSLFFLSIGYDSLAQGLDDAAIYKQKQEKAYKLIFSDPPRARKEIAILFKDEGKIPDTVMAMNWNTLAVYYGVNNFLDSAHLAFDKAIALLPEGHHRKMALINNKAIIYRKEKKFKEGIKLLDEAEKFAIQYGDSLMLGIITGEKASYFSAQNMYSSAANLLLKSIAILEKTPGTSEVNLYKEKQKLANLYFKLGEYAASEKLYKQILPFFKKQKQLDTYYISVVNLGDVYLHQNRLAEAKQQLDEGLAGLMSFPNKEMQIHALERIASLEYLQGNTAASISRYRQVFQSAKQIESARLIYYLTEYADVLVQQKKEEEAQSLLSEVGQTSNLEAYLNLSNTEEKFRYHKVMGDVYALVGQHELGTKYFQKALLLRDSLQKESDIIEARNIQNKYQSELREKENQILLQQNQLQRLFIFLIGVVMLLFSSFLIWKWYINKVKVRIKSLQVEALANEKVLLNQKLTTEKELVHLKEKIINEHRNDLMIKNIENIRLNQQLTDLLQKIEQDEVVKGTNKHILSKTEQEHWDDIILKFKQLNPDFIQKIQQFGDNLSKGDLEFCSMARMNMSNKDIARMLNISLESVRTKKYRLMKKLNIPESQDFYNWILSL